MSDAERLLQILSGLPSGDADWVLERFCMPQSIRRALRSIRRDAAVRELARSYVGLASGRAMAKRIHQDLRLRRSLRQLSTEHRQALDRIVTLSRCRIPGITTLRNILAGLDAGQKSPVEIGHRLVCNAQPQKELNDGFLEETAAASCSGR
jgi:hypothetical protein